MLWGLSMVEQRYQAVREVLDTGATITDVARRYGVDRRTLHRWLTRYADGGLGSLADRSHWPGRSPLQMPPQVEARLLALRWLNPTWGPRTLKSKLAHEFDPCRSRAAIYRALVRNGVIDVQKRKRRAADYRRWERTKAMELWQMDVVGRIYLTDGTQLSAVTGIDDHSRFCVSAKLVYRATAKPVCQALTEALDRHGIPVPAPGEYVATGAARQAAWVLQGRIPAWAPEGATTEHVAGPSPQVRVAYATATATT